MILGIDASVAVKWFVEEEQHSEALELSNKQNQLVAPDIVYAEAANVLRRKVRLNHISQTQAAIAIRDLNEAFER